MKAWVFRKNGKYYDYMEDGFAFALNNATLYSEEEDAEIFGHDSDVEFVPVEITLL